VTNRPGQWVKGQSGNPAGRPISSRHKLAERLIADISEVWERKGRDALEALDNETLAKLAFSTLPREAFLQVTQGGPGVNADQWALLRGVLDAIERSGVEAEPAQIFEEIEHALRARFAKAIEGN